MTTVELTELTTTEIASLVARGEVTPDEVIEATLDRIQALEGRVQAWSLIDAEGARAQAAVLTAEAKAGRLRGPLHGVPVGIKDEFHVEGMPTGMRGLAEPPIETQDSAVVERLRIAGAIIVGKTTMPIENVPPPTRNPWNLEHTAGGTSSGSGAAVGARMVPFAIGEQTAGSNLRPAAFNGIAGIKPTYGRISRVGCYPFAWSRDHVGIIALSVADLALVLSTVAGYDPRDPSTLHDPAPPADLRLDDVAPPRIGVVRNFFPELAEPAMLEAIERSAASLKAASANISDVRLPEEFRLTWLAARLVQPESAVFHAGQRILGGGRGGEGLGARASELIPATYYVQARRIRTWLTQMLQPLLADYDALLMPVAPGGAPYGLGSTGNASLLIPWSFLGFPAMTINGGFSPEGMPLGLQFVAAPREDYNLLRTGAWCERVLGRLPAPVL